MSKLGRENGTRTENKRRGQRSQKRSKMDRLLNTLIAIVSILIILNLVTILNDKDDEKEETKEVAQEKSNDNIKKNNEDTNSTDEAQSEQGSKNVVSAEESTDELDEESDTLPITEASSDPLVDEVIINPNWEVTKTNQTGEHVSTYQKGHIDYEEKIETFRNAVQLDENNIIIWSVKNNGSANSSIAVISNNDKTENYRISIEWIENEGWKPVKVEKLKTVNGAY